MFGGWTYLWSQYEVLDGDVFVQSVTASFEYRLGRSETVSIHRSLENPLDCTVSINGQECSFCILIDCQNVVLDGDENVLSGSDLTYDSCGINYEGGRVFEVFDMYFGDSWVGCPPVLEPLLDLI